MLSICALLVLFISEIGLFLAKLLNEMEVVQWIESSSFFLCACPLHSVLLSEQHML